MQKSKSIFLISNTSWSLYNFRRNIINYFVESGYVVYVCAPHDSTSVFLQEMGALFIPLNFRPKSINPISEAITFLRLLSIIWKIKPSIIFSYTIKPVIYTGILACFVNIPVIAVTTGLGFIFSGNAPRWLVGAVEFAYKLSFKLVKEVWTLNQDDGNFLLTRGLVSSQKLFVLHGEGISLSHYTSSGPKLSSDSLTFLMVARLINEKGVGEYIKAAKIVKNLFPNTKFLLLGQRAVGGANAVSLGDITSGVSAGFLEFHEETDDVRPLMNSADVIVLPSYYREGIPRVLLEAGAMSKPALTTDNVGCRDVIVDGFNGFLCKPKSVDSLVSSMIRFVRIECEEYNKMAKNSLDNVANRFSDDIVIDFYHQALRRNGFFNE